MNQLEGETDTAIPLSNADAIGQIIKQYLTKFGLTSGIGKLKWQLTENKITGKFTAKVAGNILKLFDFTVSNDGLEFQQATRSDSYIQGITNSIEVNPFIRSDSSFYYLDAKQKQCTIGHKCGASCIEARDKCSVKGGEAARIGSQIIKLAQQSQSGEHSPALKKKLAQIESEIRSIDTHEEFVAIGQDGKIITRIGGDATSVQIPNALKDKLKGQVVTHNHPTWRYYPDDPRLQGRSLSHPDLLAAQYFDVGEVRAVAPGYSYSLKPGEKGWGSEHDINFNYTKHSVFTHWDLTQKIRAGEITAEEADRDFQGEIVKRVAKDMGWNYTETKLPISATEKKKAKKLVEKHGPMQLPGSGETANTLVVSGLAPFVQGMFLTAVAASVYADLKAAEEQGKPKRS